MFRAPAMRRRPLIPVFLATVICLTTVKAQTREADLTAADRVVVASRIYSFVQLYFAHWDGVPRNKIEEAYRRYADRIVGASSRREFDLATLLFVAQLKNGHTQFFTPPWMAVRSSFGF